MERKENVNKRKNWWETRNAVISITIIIILFGAGFIFWFLNIMPYISTEDARVDSNIVRVANLGANGQIIAVKFKEGDKIAKDSILVELDHGIAQAQYEKAKTKAKLTATDLKRAKALLAAQGISKQQFDRLFSDAVTAEMDFKLAQIALDRTYIKSLVDGIIIQKTAEVGNVVETNQVIATLADIENAWISANVNEKSIPIIKIGQPVKVFMDDGGVLEGKVIDVRNATASVFAIIPSDNASGNFIKVEQRIPIKIELISSTGHVLRVGQSAKIKIKVR